MYIFHFSSGCLWARLFWGSQGVVQCSVHHFKRYQWSRCRFCCAVALPMVCHGGKMLRLATTVGHLKNLAGVNAACTWTGREGKSFTDARL